MSVLEAVGQRDCQVARDAVAVPSEFDAASSKGSIDTVGWPNSDVAMPATVQKRMQEQRPRKSPVERDQIGLEQEQPGEEERTTIRQYTARQLWTDHALVLRIADAYRSIFGAAPWNEWKRCSTCRAKVGAAECAGGDSTRCPRCLHGSLAEYHPVSQVAERLLRELSTPYALSYLFVAEREGSGGERQVLGFTWGYGMPVEDIVRNVIGEYFADLPEEVGAKTLPRILSRLEARCPSGTATYISHIGVVDGARGSDMLFARMGQAVAEQQIAAGNSMYVHWTIQTSRAYTITRLLAGTVLCALDEYIPGDERVFMVGDSIRLLKLFQHCPADKLRSYFIRVARDLKTGRSQDAA